MLFFFFFFLQNLLYIFFFFFSSRRRHTRWTGDWSSDVYSSDLTALVTSDGQHYRVPRISDRRAARYLALQRRMSRQRKGSRKREKTRRAMAAISVTVTDRRKDWAEKVSTRLVRDHDLIVFEKLRTKNMVRKPKPKPGPDQPGAFLPNRRRQKAGL